MNDTEIDEAIEYINKIAELLYKGLAENTPDGSDDEERQKKYDALNLITSALGIAHMKLQSLKSE